MSNIHNCFFPLAKQMAVSTYVENAVLANSTERKNVWFIKFMHIFLIHFTNIDRALTARQVPWQMLAEEQGHICKMLH